MKLAAILLSVIALSAEAPSPELLQVKRIYLLSMGSGLDQFLASRITRDRRFEVVTDPQLADALLTDRVGEPFERRFDELYPPPPKEEAAEDTDKDDAKDKSPGLIEQKLIRSSSFGKGRGNVFLVDRKTRKVIWAYYKRPKDTTPDNLDRLADKIADRLRKESVSAPAKQ
ncbi:MAG TPA: hypothetical protein VM120_11375 [Bryobacteraceae bacterium]|nr:hypothetical protein [Bryobacteraceae bacterium]